MQLKSFSARTHKEVLTLIKDELGPDAIILDTQEEDGIITMTAALERVPVSRPQAAAEASGGDAAPVADKNLSPGFEPLGGRASRYQPLPQDVPPPAPVTPPARPGRKTAAEALSEERAALLQGQIAPRSIEVSKKRAHSAYTAQQSAPAESDPPAAAPAGNAQAMPPGWQQWHEEWSTIKNQLLALMKPALRLDLLPPRQRLAIEFLQREGVEDAAILHLFQRLQGDPSASILAPLAQMVPVRTWNETEWPQRLQVIAGPFGAGKTSVAIRMALSLRKTAPTCRICLVNADATRGNGRLLLRHYCDLSHMAYKEASTTLELVAALNVCLREGYDRVLVDLPGLSRGRYLSTLLSDAGLADRTGETADDLAVHLTLPPHYGTLQLRGILARYRTEHAGSIVWTKLDEAEHYGQIVNVATQTGLPVSCLSFGPGLGNSLAPAKENMLWRLLFKRELPLGG